MSKQRSHKVRKHPSRTSVLIEEQISAIQSMCSMTRDGVRSSRGGMGVAQSRENRSAPLRSSLETMLVMPHQEFRGTRLGTAFL